MLSRPLCVLAVPTFLFLTTLVSWFRIICLSTNTSQMFVVLLPWESDESALSASTWLLKQPKLTSVPLFSPRHIIVILFCLAHLSFSWYYKQFRTLQWNWFSNHAGVIMSNLFFKLFIGYRFKPEQTTDCQLSVTTSFSDSSPAHLSDLTVYTPSRELRPRSGELRTQKLKSHLVRTQSSNVLPFKPGVGQYIAIHATLTAKGVLPCLFLPFQSIHLHFFQNLSQFFPVLACRIK